MQELKLRTINGVIHTIAGLCYVPFIVGFGVWVGYCEVQRAMEKWKAEVGSVGEEDSLEGEGGDLEVRDLSHKELSGRLVKRNSVRLGGEEQVGSLLFRLPLEIREMVYREYFGKSEEVLVMLYEGRLGGWRNVGGHERLSERYVPDEEWGVRGRVDVLPLLLSCRKIYTEAFPYLYSTPTYTFLNPKSFLAFAATIPTQQLRNLEKVYVDYYNDYPVKFLADPSLYAGVRWPERGWMSSTVLSPHGYPFVGYSFYPVHPHLEVVESGIEYPSFWTSTCEMLGWMERLRELRVVFPRGGDRKFATEVERQVLKGLEGVRADCRVEVEMLWEGVVKRWRRRKGRCGKEVEGMAWEEVEVGRCGSCGQVV
ncbi:hypothetical protein CC78DRAFT_615483 [Lojkania enalia]|uniref:DUF7730 domain-containing protein n=1 Tax=Lojkania enalia TaxID=147567 RepID=A0A9P4N8P9_9PLEO|nr:hypothetical protein CC78DRAFT_615483 [Didymosphaeria enalia]